MTPARFESGALPAQPLMTQNGGEVFLELDVDASGRVSGVRTLRSTPPFTDLLREAVQGWRFEPARETGEAEQPTAVESSVLVAGLFRPPTLYSGAMPGQPPQDVAGASIDLPFPSSTATPAYPPDALSNRVVLVEVEVGEDGKVAGATMARSAPGFDSAALDAARQWTFRPARRSGAPTSSLAYIVFGFREPVAIVPPQQ